MNKYITLLVFIIVIITIRIVYNRNKLKNSVLEDVVNAPKEYKVATVISFFSFLVTTILVIFFINDVTIDDFVVLTLILVSLTIINGFVMLYFNFCKIEIKDNVLLYYNLFGKISEFDLNDLSKEIKGNSIVIYKKKNKLFRVSWMFNNTEILTKRIKKYRG